jgi:hypothetical protein
MGGGEKCLQGFGWEVRGEETMGRPRLRWEDNINIGWLRIGPIVSFYEYGNESLGSMQKASYSLTS